MFSKIQLVRVQEVIMEGSPNVIGNIKYSHLNFEKSVNTKNLNSARPLFNNISQFPVVNEIIAIIGAPKDTYNNNNATMAYYLPPININGSSNHNALPNSFTDEEVEAGVETGLDYFKEIENVRPLQPYLGDIMLEGRYGQSIRFGSTISGSRVPNNWSNEGQAGNPITIIRNGQVGNEQGNSFEHILEDVNGDDSSVYLCSNQQITNFKKAGISPNNHPASYKHML